MNDNKIQNSTQLDTSTSNITIFLGWRANQDYEIDLSIFLLDKNGHANNDKHFLYYNKKEGADGAIKLLDNNVNDASATISLDDLHSNSPEIDKIGWCLILTYYLDI